MPSLHDFQMSSITGETVSLSDYEGKVSLVVNLASQ
jgi:glutathione peroxidase-family protein